MPTGHGLHVFCPDVDTNVPALHDAHVVAAFADVTFGGESAFKPGSGVMWHTWSVRVEVAESAGRESAGTLVALPAGTIGNLDPVERRALLAKIAEEIRPRDSVLVATETVR